MLRDILSSKLVITGLIGCVLLVAGSLLYRWHVQRDIRNDEAKTERFLQQLENRQTTNAQQPRQITARDAEEQAAAPVATDNGAATVFDITERLPNSKAARGDTAAVPELPASDKETAKEESVALPISPFGFGPYPEVPEDFPEPDIFKSLASMGDSEMRKTLELQKRLIVECWKQGISLENVGVTGDADGKVYLLYPDVVYVKWDYWTDDDGITHRYAGVTRGHPDTAHIYEPYLDEGEIPPGITVHELPDGYIDAYEFLGLTR